jgi:hypothetical protein
MRLPLRIIKQDGRHSPVQPHLQGALWRASQQSLWERGVKTAPVLPGSLHDTEGCRAAPEDGETPPEHSGRLSSISTTGRLSILHSARSYPGAPSANHNRLITFMSEGEATGLDIVTVAFDENQLTITSDVFVPGSVERMLQLLSDELMAELPPLQGFRC